MTFQTAALIFAQPAVNSSPEEKPLPDSEPAFRTDFERKNPSESGLLKPTKGATMETPKATRTIWIDPGQYEELCEYAEETGQTVEEALREALTDHIDVITRQLGIARHNRN